jgi:2,4-dienoyl-CoA reductase-like NADH-dependent reductase (Old Yellow Enzyme family)/thioredoxin reductase
MILKSLFSPEYIGILKLKNRVVFPPMATALCDDGGFVSRKLIDYHVSRAAGGCGLSIVEISGVHPTTMGNGRFGLGIYDDKFIPGLRELAKAIKNAGGVPAVQLWHAGRQINSSDVISGYIVAPSPIPCPVCKEIPRQLDQREINELVESFGDAAARAKEAGFEAVEIHGAHGYLICQFLSGYSNRRNDNYSGSIEKRSRFAVEIVRDIRAKTSSYFPVLFRLSAEEFVEGGINISESKQIAKILENAGVDAIHVSAGNYHSLHYAIPPMETALAFNAERAQVIKETVKIPVIVAARINDPFIADKLISDGKADFTSIGRGQLADPEFCNKASNDEFSQILKCIACNQGCFDRLFYEKKHISCLLNPACGREREFAFYRPVLPFKGVNANNNLSGISAENITGIAALKMGTGMQDELSKKILIAGGGPAGLTSAAILSAFGFKVIICEKSNNIGGQFKLGSIAPDKEAIADALSAMQTLAEKSGAEIRFQTEVDRYVIERINPDIVIIATGSSPIIPDIPFISYDPFLSKIPSARDDLIHGNKSMLPVTSHEVLSGAVTVKQNVAIIGGGITGVETAEFLAKQGKKIVILEMGQEIAPDLSPLRKYFLKEKINNLEISVFTSTKCTGIGSDFIEVEKDGVKMQMGKTESVVFACGVKQDNKLAETLKSMRYPFYVTGDALKPAKAIDAILAAAELARTICLSSL